MLSSTLSRFSRVATPTVQRRGMAGFPARYGVKKNKFVEEWNGKREITEKTFAVEFSSVPTLVLYLMLFPFGVYTLSRSELKSRGDRRYKDCF